MRDGTWLDVRIIERGVIERVRLVELCIRRESEELVFEQEAMVSGETQRVEHRIDPEDVIWARRTMFDMEDVEVTAPAEAPVSNDELRKAILETVLFWRRISERELIDEFSGQDGRYYCMRLMWEFSTVAQSDIPQMFSDNRTGGIISHALHNSDPKLNPDRAKKAAELKDLLELRLGRRLRPARRKTTQTRLFGTPS